VNFIEITDMVQHIHCHVRMMHVLLFLHQNHSLVTCSLRKIYLSVHTVGIFKP